jgi:hypothetical protein
MLIFAFTVLTISLPAAETWQTALSQMPLKMSVTQLTRTNCVELLLRAFQSNDVVKALVFMPGATDEFYFFRRALTNQTLIRVTFRSPMLLLHTDEDPLEPLFRIEDRQTEERLRRAHFVPHAFYNDRDWDYLLPILSRKLKTKFLPYRKTRDSWHFFRHSLAGWNLTGWEALEAISLAGKTTFTVQKRRLIFEGDTRKPKATKP